MNKQEFKEGQEVWVRCTVVDPEPTSDAEVVVTESNFSQEIWVNLENIIVPPEKVTVPKFVADWIILAREKCSTLRQALDHFLLKGEIQKWLQSRDNQVAFVRAWLDGYEVEREKLYTVEIPNPNSMAAATILEKFVDGDYISFSLVFTHDKNWKNKTSSQLTEAEIRKDFDWAWKDGFAKEIKENL